MKLPGGIRIRPLYEPTHAGRLGAEREVWLGSVRLGSARAGVGEPRRVFDAEISWILGDGSDATGADVVEQVDGAGTSIRASGSVLAHGIDAHDRGGSIPLEVALAVARWIETRREGSDAAIAVAVGPEIFVEAAKLRAIRALVERASAALEGPRGVRLFARTSLVSFSRIEPETNALRATLSVAAALFGGADVVACAPYDLLSPLAGPERERAARLASATALVASLEAHLTGLVDPLYGAPLVETLTDEIARSAWELVRELERAGGAGHAEPIWRARLERDRAERSAMARTGRLPRVGATKLARRDAPMLGPVHPALAHVERDAAPFEALRDAQTARPTSVLVVGDPARLARRLAYLEETLATWGATVRVVRAASVEAALEAVARQELPLDDAIVLCAEDADLERLPPLVAALAPRATILVAGRPGAHEAALTSAGASAFVFIGADLPRTASAFYAKKGDAS